MIRRLVAIVLACLISSSPFAKSIILGPVSSAVDVKGVRHTSKEFRGKPFVFRDLVHSLTPAYPLFDERRGHQGAGLFRITIDPGTGSVTNVAILQSTGHVSLDRRVLLVLKVWRWKPGTWKQVDLPITFQIGGTIYVPRAMLPPKL